MSENIQVILDDGTEVELTRDQLVAALRDAISEALDEVMRRAIDRVIAENLPAPPNISGAEVDYEHGRIRLIEDPPPPSP